MPWVFPWTGSDIGSKQDQGRVGKRGIGSKELRARIVASFAIFSFYFGEWPICLLNYIIFITAQARFFVQYICIIFRASYSFSSSVLIASKGSY